MDSRGSSTPLNDERTEVAPPADETKWPVPDLPPRVIVDLRTDCNLKCPMCVVHGEPDNPILKDWIRRDTDFEKLEPVLDELTPAKSLMMPSLWSEPTLAKHFIDYVRGCKERGLSVAMNTNGLTLRENTARLFVEIGLDAVAFSIDSTTPEVLKKVRGVDKLDKLKAAVEMMLRVRGDAALPRVGVSFVIQDANRHQEQEFVDTWAHKVDFVRTSELFESGGFPTIEVSEERQPCPALYSTMAIHVDGNVSYCCLDGFAETSVGNVFEEGAHAVWHGDRLNEVRHYHETGQWDKVPFCKSCDRWASYGFEEEVRDGLLIRRSPEYTYYNRIDRLDNWHGKLLGNHKDPQESLSELQEPVALSAAE